MPAIVEHRVGVGQAQQRRLAGAERHRRVERHPVHDVERLNGLRDRRHADIERQVRGGEVARLDQRVFERRRPDVVAVVIGRPPRRQPGTLRDFDRRVLDRARQRIAVLQRGQIDERLDRRAGLPLRLRRAVELALLERPAADQREDPAGLRVHHDEAAADIGDLAQRRTSLPPPPLAAPLPRRSARPARDRRLARRRRPAAPLPQAAGP